MTVNQEIQALASEIEKEIKNPDIDLRIGDIEDPALATPVLCERMDRICAMMDYQATLISLAESEFEEAKYQHNRKEQAAKKKYNEAFVGFKNEDRLKPRDQRRTDKEYEAMAELEADILVNESISADRVYLKAQHKLSDEKHRYEILNNHFLSYRKACDMLSKEMQKLGGGWNNQNR